MALAFAISVSAIVACEKDGPDPAADPEVVRIEASVVPFLDGHRVEFNTGQTLDELRPFIRVYLVYSDNSTVETADYSLEGVLEVGSTTLTVRSAGFAATVSIDVVAGPEPDPEPEPEPDYYSVKGIGYLYKEVSVVPTTSQTAHGDYFPDGKLIPVRKGEKWQMFWSEYVSYLTEAESPWPEDHIADLTSDKVVFGKGISKVENLNENGSWFIGVFPQDQEGHYIGFFHGESHFGTDGVAYKTIGVAYSDDYGRHWRNAAPAVIGDKPKSECDNWSGTGDGCVIWDAANSRYICYYCSVSNSSKISMAASPSGASGTWKKWDGNDFTVEGYDARTGVGELEKPVEGLSRVAGGNPSVMWNECLHKWIMAYHSWGKLIYFSTSEDGINWSTPVSSRVQGCYPNLISSSGDLVGGQEIKMYFSYNQNPDNGRRKIGVIRISLDEGV